MEFPRTMSKRSEQEHLMYNEAMSVGHEDDISIPKSRPYNFTECVRLQNTMAKTFNDLPISCQEILKKEEQMKKAWEGAPVSQRASAIVATSHGYPNRAQIQRRYTSTRDTKRGCTK